MKKNSAIEVLQCSLLFAEAASNNRFWIGDVINRCSHHGYNVIKRDWVDYGNQCVHSTDNRVTYDNSCRSKCGKGDILETYRVNSYVSP